MTARFSKPQHEPSLDRRERRARGVFYTPAEVAHWIVQEIYGPLLREWNGQMPPPRLHDPACGAGVFLGAAAELLQERCAEVGWDEQKTQRAISQAIDGVDIDRSTVAAARGQLQSCGVTCIERADSLTGTAAPQYDAIVGNPPYVSIRELAKSRSAVEIQKLRASFHTARGNFDLYVLFIERALQLLKPGGRLGFVIPNKWATLDYARPLRELLLRETTIEHIVDLSSLRVFPQAGTYPQIVLLRRQIAPARHGVRVTSVGEDGTLRAACTQDCRSILQNQLTARALVLGEELRVEERVPTLRLEECAQLHSGAAGYSANLLAGSLVELSQVARAEQNRVAEFIVSGNIDRYAIQPGDVRFLKRTWQRPCLPLAAGQLTPAKAQLYREPKLVLSGMSRRLKAAYDTTGYALGVQVYAAADLKVDPYYLLGLLNSKLLTYLFRERFAAKRLAGGYFSLNKGQLAQLPIRQLSAPDVIGRKLARPIANLAQQLQQSYSRALDQQLDELVYRLYEITAGERERIEKAIENLALVRSRRGAA